MAGMLQNLPATLRRQGFNLMQDFGDTHGQKLNRLATKNKWDRGSCPSYRPRFNRIVWRHFVDMALNLAFNGSTLILQELAMNRLLFGDNLKWLRDPKIFPDASVDLVYLDPPFNSNADYNVLFREASGEASQAQFHAFTDTWNWADAAQTFTEFVDTCPNTAVIEMVEALHSFLKNSPMMAYLAMMAPRLVELHRVLKPTGSLYLHCDPTASHYLRMLLDGIFRQENFRNEIIWERTSAKGDVRRKFGSNHDVILTYGKSDKTFFQSVYTEPDEDYIGRFKLDDNDGKGVYRLAPLDSPNPRPNLTYDYKGFKPPVKGWRVSRELMEQLDAEGRLAFPKTSGGRIAKKHYLSEQLGPKIGDVWTDISPLQAVGLERLG
jgi:site-specific DNA-methyltransferase (adenine-specific)